MQFRTSTLISSSKVQVIEQRLHKAAQLTNHDKFWPRGEKLEVLNEPEFSSVEVLATEAAGMTPEGDPTLCYLAYQAALSLCGDDDDICSAVAYAAYQYCLAH
jgi:hypothetical protein